MATPNFDNIYPKLIEITFPFLNLHQQAKNQFIPSTHSWDTVNFRVLWPDWLHPSVTTPTSKFFDQLLIYVNLCQHVKNQAILFVLEISLIKEPCNLRTFWPISQKQKLWDLCRNTANNTHFHYRSNSVKINDQTFQ